MGSAGRGTPLFVETNLRVWKAALAALVAVRLAVPLVALAASGHRIPGLPPYDYEPLVGDATGFYATARELISAAAGPAGAIALLVLAAGAIAVRSLRVAWLRLLTGGAAVSLAATAVVLASAPAGAAVVGWPLLWAVLLVPFRVAGVLNEDVAFAVAFPVALAANGVTVVATAYAGYWGTGRRSVGLAAAALFALWPLLARPLAGPSAWENGQWSVDVGLALYTEPISTALVASALALLLAPQAGAVHLATAGLVLGLATAVKVSNAVIGAVACAFVVWRLGIRRAVPFALASLAFVPLVAAYWPLGYPTVPNVPGYSVRFAARSWGDSLIFDPKTLLVLLPLALAGLLALPRRAAVFIGGTVLATSLFYTFLENTYLHPRFLYVALPVLFVLEAAGGWLVIRKASESLPERGL